MKAMESREFLSLYQPVFVQIALVIFLRPESLYH